MADPTFEDLKAELAASLPKIQQALFDQASIAIKSLVEVSGEVAKQGMECLKQLVRVGGMVASGSISVETGELAVKNYLDALGLLGSATEYAAAKEACDRGQALLKTVAEIGLTILSIAIKVGLGQAGGILAGLSTVTV